MAKKNLELKAETLRRMRSIIDECGGVNKIKPNQLRNNKRYIALHKDFMNGYERRISDEIIAHIYDGKTDDEIQLIYKELRETTSVDVENENSNNIADEMEQATEAMFIKSKNRVVEGPIVIDTTVVAESVEESKSDISESADTTELENKINETAKKFSIDSKHVKKLLKEVKDVEGGIEEKVLAGLKKYIGREMESLKDSCNARFEELLNNINYSVDDVVSNSKNRKEAFDKLQETFKKHQSMVDAIGLVDLYTSELRFDADSKKSDKKFIKKLAAAIKASVCTQMDDSKTMLYDTFDDLLKTVNECETVEELSTIKSDVNDIKFDSIEKSTNTTGIFYDIMVNIHKKALAKVIGENKADAMLECAVDWNRVQSLINEGIVTHIGRMTDSIVGIFDKFFERGTEAGDDVKDETNDNTTSVKDEVVNEESDDSDENDDVIIPAGRRTTSVA